MLEQLIEIHESQELTPNQTTMAMFRLFGIDEGEQDQIVETAEAIADRELYDWEVCEEVFYTLRARA